MRSWRIDPITAYDALVNYFELTDTDAHEIVERYYKFKSQEAT